MSNQAVDVVQNRIKNVIKIHKEAEDVSNAEIIGVLEIIKLELYQEMLENQEPDMEEY